jgi:lauroyl/myristoyl acyltransferase
VDIVHRNLQLLDPAISRPRARQVYAEFARTLADYFHLGAKPAADAASIVSHVSGHEHLAAARKKGRGGIVVTAHFGLFELGGLMLGQEGLPATVLTFPEPSAELTAWRAEFRRRWGVDTLEVGANPFAFVEIAGRLRRGEFIATLIDRPTPGSDVPVQFPGGPARFSTGILLLAAHLGCPVIPALVSRQADGSYRSQVFAPLEIIDRGSREETLRHYSQALADIFLPVLSATPEQWYQFVPLAPSTSPA